MAKKLTIDEFILRANKIHKKYNYKNYNGLKYNVDIFCSEKDHGWFSVSANTHLYDKVGCPFCSRKKFNINLLYSILDNYKYNINFIYCLDDIVYSLNDNISMKCLKCNNINNKKIKNIIHKNTGCKCNKGLDMKETFINRASKINPKYNYDFVNFINSRTKVKIICDNNHIFYQTPDNHIYKKQGCPKCNISYGEKEIIKILNDKNINFIHQYKFDKCYFKRKLSFDFYLPDLNICIEYDGIQHFKEVKFFGGKQKLIYIQNNDFIKNNYCKRNNIKLIRISYDENIKNKLKDI